MRAELNERERRTTNYLAPDANEVVVMCFIPFSLSALWFPVSYSTFFSPTSIVFMIYVIVRFFFVSVRCFAVYLL